MAGKFYKAWVAGAAGTAGAGLTLAERPVPAVRPAGVLVRIEGATVLSYMGKVLDGTLGYALPPAPFVPGTNAIGRVEAAGSEVFHLKPGDRVFLSPHLVADEPTASPGQILIGLTATGTDGFGGLTEGSLGLQQIWRDGVFAEYAHWPASCVTRLEGLDAVPVEPLLALTKLVVPYGGLLRGRLEAGQVVVVNGATGYFGAGAVMVALAMGAARVVAAGRDQEALARVRALGARVRPAIVGGGMAADLAALAAAAGGQADLALDLLGGAASTETTLAALRSLRRGGRLVLMGSAAVPLELDFRDMLRSDWEVIGNFMYPGDAPARLAALVRAGLLDLAPVRTKAFPLSRLPDAITAAASMRDLDLTLVTPDAV